MGCARTLSGAAHAARCFGGRCQQFFLSSRFNFIPKKYQANAPMPRNLLRPTAAPTNSRKACAPWKNSAAASGSAAAVSPAAIPSAALAAVSPLSADGCGR